MPKSLLCCYNTWILYVYEDFFLNFQTDLLYNIWVFCKLLSYPQQRVCFFFRFYFNLWLIACFILGYSFSKSFSSILLQLSSSEFELVSFAILFQNQVSIELLSSLLVSMVLNLSSSVLSYFELKKRPVFNFFFFKNFDKSNLYDVMPCALTFK